MTSQPKQTSPPTPLSVRERGSKKGAAVGHRSARVFYFLFPPLRRGEGGRGGEVLGGWRGEVFARLHSGISHNLTVISVPAEASCRPSGDTATAVTGPVCP